MNKYNFNSKMYRTALLADARMWKKDIQVHLQYTGEL